jgi:DNA-binding NarL/FixJ family response regulator
MKSSRREQPSLGAAQAELSALVLCAVPIVRAGIVHVIRARFGGELRVAGTDGQAAPKAPAADDERFDIKIFHLAGLQAADRPSRIAAAVQDSVVIAFGAPARAQQHALPAAVHWVALGAPLDEWCRVVRSALDEARGRVPAFERAGAGRGLLPRRRANAALTPRQREVFDMLRLGHSNRSIAEKLGLSTGTVKLHVGAILQAVNAKRRVEIVLRGAGMQQLPGVRAAAAAHRGRRPALLLDAPADDRLE